MYLREVNKRLSQKKKKKKKSQSIAPRGEKRQQELGPPTNPDMSVKHNTLPDSTKEGFKE